MNIDLWKLARRAVRVGGSVLQGTAYVARRALERRRAARVLDSFPPPRKLHVGCGSIHFDGWLNIDQERTPAVDLRWDVRFGLPGEPESSQLIYCEHFLEHLTADEGVAFLAECHRTLAPGGVLRIAMPSLEYLLDRAQSPDWADQDWLRWPEYRGVKTRAEMLNIAFRSWGHQWLYDREELQRRLKEAGFTRFSFMGPNESAHTELRQRESRKDSLLVCEAAK